MPQLALANIIIIGLDLALMPRWHMAHSFSLYTLHLPSDYRFRLGGRRYRLGCDGARALELLAHIAQQAPQRGDAYWLVRLRCHIREIEQIDPRVALTLVVDRTRDARLRHLAIWLRGRCGGTLGAAAVSRFSTSRDGALRKEVARCLKRLGAWSELRRIAKTDTDPKVRQFATQSPPKPYRARLTAYSKHILRRTVAPSRSELVVAPGLDVHGGRPARPRWLLRMILERIHRLLTGSAH